MAAEVSSLVRVLTGYNKDDRHRTVGNESGPEKLPPLITRDLLSGGYSKFTEPQELDLDLQVPSGWEKRLDLKSGKMFIQRCNVQDFNNHPTNQTVPKLQDLNFPPSFNYSKFQLSNHFVDETNLDLKLVSSSPSPSPSPRSNYQSVCTLDKVKSALERAEKHPIRKRSSLWKSSPSPSYSSSSSSAAAGREFQEEDNFKSLLSSSSAAAAAPIAAGCPGCLSYVLVMMNNPTCPRCSSVVPLPAAKKPRIDLNVSI